jgi:pyrroloquinoline quinone biosynthesis protein D
MAGTLTNLSKPKLSRKAQMRYDEVRQADLLLLPERVVKLNATAAAILRLCDGNRTVEEMAQELESRFQQPGGLPDGVFTDIMEFLQKASEQRWVE